LRPANTIQNRRNITAGKQLGAVEGCLAACDLLAEVRHTVCVYGSRCREIAKMAAVGIWSKVVED
jgi:hypothetical protein